MEWIRAAPRLTKPLAARSADQPPGRRVEERDGRAVRPLWPGVDAARQPRQRRPSRLQGGSGSSKGWCRDWWSAATLIPTHRWYQRADATRHCAPPHSPPPDSLWGAPADPHVRGLRCQPLSRVARDGGWSPCCSAAAGSAGRLTDCAHPPSPGTDSHRTSCPTT
jgi:hypothetical protein